MDDVATEAGVSRALVSLVMRGSPKVSDKRRAAVLEAADALGYRPNAAARALAERRSNTIGVIINDLHNPFFADVVDGIHDAAVEAGYRLLMNTSWLGDEAAALEAFLEHRVDGIMMLGPMATTEIIQRAAKQSPLVAIGSPVPGVDSVVNDDERGGELVAQHLVDLGHDDIAHIDGGTGAGAAGRKRGFLLASEAAGLKPRVVGGDYSEEAGSRGAKKLLGTKRRPTAIFAPNDLAAIGVLDRLQSAGLQTPEDVSVVGYDDTLLASLTAVSLTTINQPRAEMGRVGFECVMERLDGGRKAPVAHVLSPELVVRRTTGAPPV